jgi:predicted nucleic acid-binding protein
VLTVAELFAGVREGKDRKSLETLQVVPLDEETAKLGGLWLRDYSKSHGVGLADALIAATAKLQGCTLVTLNTKHFPMLTTILSPYQKR